MGLRNSGPVVCIEPIVQGAGGMLIQPSGFLRAVRDLWYAATTCF